MQHLAGLRFERIAAQVLVFLLHLAEARQNAVHFARSRRIVHGLMQFFQLVMQIAIAAAAA